MWRGGHAGAAGEDVMVSSEDLWREPRLWAVTTWIRRNLVDAAPLWAQLYRSARANVHFEVNGGDMRDLTLVAARRNAHLGGPYSSRR